MSQIPVDSGGESGKAVCEIGSDDTTLTVVGFQSFAQDCSLVQNFDEDDDIHEELEKGYIAFYGMFQLPEELIKNYNIWT